MRATGRPSLSRLGRPRSTRRSSGSSKSARRSNEHGTSRRAPKRNRGSTGSSCRTPRATNSASSDRLPATQYRSRSIRQWAQRNPEMLTEPAPLATSSPPPMLRGRPTAAGEASGPNHLAVPNNWEWATPRKPDSSGPRQYGQGLGVWLVGSIFIGRGNRNRVLKASPPDQVEVGEGQSFVPGGTRLIKDHAFLGP